MDDFLKLYIKGGAYVGLTLYALDGAADILSDDKVYFDSLEGILMYARNGLVLAGGGAAIGTLLYATHYALKKNNEFFEGLREKINNK